MFYLRKINQHEQVNQKLGEEYSLIVKSQSPENFNQCLEDVFGKDVKSEECVGFVMGDVIVPLYQDNHYYIMTDSGKTYDNISSHL